MTPAVYGLAPPPQITKLCVPIGSRWPLVVGGLRSSSPLRTAWLMSSPPSDPSMTIATAPVGSEMPEGVWMVFVMLPSETLDALMIL